MSTGYAIGGVEVGGFGRVTGQKIKVGMVGSGRMARIHGKTIVGDPGAQIEAVLNPNLGGARRFAQELGGQAVADWATLATIPLDALISEVSASCAQRSGGPSDRLPSKVTGSRTIRRGASEVEPHLGVRFSN